MVAGLPDVVQGHTIFLPTPSIISHCSTCNNSLTECITCSNAFPFVRLLQQATPENLRPSFKAKHYLQPIIDTILFGVHVSSKFHASGFLQRFSTVSLLPSIHNTSLVHSTLSQLDNLIRLAYHETPSSELPDALQAMIQQPADFAALANNLAPLSKKVFDQQERQLTTTALLASTIGAPRTLRVMSYSDGHCSTTSLEDLIVTAKLDMPSSYLQLSRDNDSWGKDSLMRSVVEDVLRFADAHMSQLNTEGFNFFGALPEFCDCTTRELLADALTSIRQHAQPILVDDTFPPPAPKKQRRAFFDVIHIRAPAPEFPPPGPAISLADPTAGPGGPFWHRDDGITRLGSTNLSGMSFDERQRQIYRGQANSNSIRPAVNIDDPWGTFSMPKSVSDGLLTWDEKQAAMHQWSVVAHDTREAISAPGGTSSLSPAHQWVLARGKADDAKFFQNRCGPLSGADDILRAKFTKYARENRLPIGEDEYKLLRGHQVFYLDMNLFENNKAIGHKTKTRASTSTKKIDDARTVPLRGYPDLVLQLEVLEKVYSVFIGEVAATYIGYWKGTLQNLREANVPWDSAYDAFLHILLDFSERWKNYVFGDSAGPPLPWDLERHTLKRLKSAEMTGTLQFGTNNIPTYFEVPVAVGDSIFNYAKSGSPAPAPAPAPATKSKTPAKPAAKPAATPVAKPRGTPAECRFTLSSCPLYKKYKICRFHHPDAPSGKTGREQDLDDAAKKIMNDNDIKLDWSMSKTPAPTFLNRKKKTE